MARGGNPQFEGFQRVESWTEDYRKVVDTYEAFVKVLEDLISSSLKRSGFAYPEVTGRAKDVLSFREKVQRPGKNYRDPLREITDLAGIRVVVQYEDEIDKVNRVLAKEFKIDKVNSVDKRKELGPDQFGYRSVHAVIQLGRKRASLGEYKQFAGLKAEVQVRTVLQHAWAAAEHTLVYKSGKEPSDDYKRRFIRLASLLELVDDQFISLRNSEHGRWATVGNEFKLGRFDIGVDAITLKQYCLLAAVPRQIDGVARQLELHRQEHRDEHEIYSDLMGVCEITGVRTIEQLDARLRVALPSAQAVFSARDNHIRQHVKRPWLTCPEYLLTTLLIATHRPLLKAKAIHAAMEIDPLFVKGLLVAARAASNHRGRR